VRPRAEPRASTASKRARPDPWWRRAVVYEVYPRSFADGNGDGIGDLIGLRQRLGHFVELGVDALWLTPINPSGGVDGGYDVTDYTAVDDVYGGMEAFDAFLEEARRVGLRVLIDIVPNHTSDRHPWFVEARSSRTSARRDWYVWADARDGGPPNNWTSAFGGPAWTLDAASDQYYLTSFYPQQVDLNWRNPEVRSALLDAMRFWVDRGVDGFRIDVVMMLAKDPGLRDNPKIPGGDEGIDGQLLVHSQNHPDVHDFVREMRVGLPPDICLLGEVWLRRLEDIFLYLRPGELDLAFNFMFAIAPWEAEARAATIELAESLGAEIGAWPCYHLSNHDGSRHASLIGAAAVRAAAVLLLTLRGTPVLYAGEEIGMENVEVPEGRRVDKVGRDAVRTPMRWDDSENAGFTPAGVTPWLPIGGDIARRNVAAHAADPDSVLSLYRRLLKLRRSSRALSVGSFRRVPAADGVLAYVREDGDERLWVAVNFRAEHAAVGALAGTVAVDTVRTREGRSVGATLELAPHEAVVVQLDPSQR
jgi:alpha-glucosidase